LAPGIETGPKKVHCRFENSKETELLTRMVKVFMLSTLRPADTDGNWRVPCPETTVKLLGFKLVSVAVDAGSADAVPFIRAALYV